MFKFSAHIFLFFMVLVAGTVACSAGSAAVPGAGSEPSILLKRLRRVSKRQ